jgi:CRISPR-associated protein Cas2
VDLIITYDVNTLTRAGRSRLRKISKICEGHGQRVQYSVFECKVTEAQRVTLTARLLKIVNEKEDSLRVYLLRGGRAGAVESYGRDSYVDFTQPLIA